MSLKRFTHYFVMLPVVAVLLSLTALFLWGLRPGIDLKGGSILEVAYPEGRPETALVQEQVNALGIGEVRVQPAGESEYVLRQRSLTPEEKDRLDAVLASFGTIEEVQYNSVGPSIGAELIQKAWWAIGLVSLSIIAFIAFAFRHVSEPVSSWKYGIVAIVTLVHDILIPTGYFAYLGHAHGSEVGVLFIVALLTILGISINDTIVVFDRIRENLSLNEAKKKVEAFEDVVWKSITQTLARSVNTSITVIIMLLALFAWGPESTRDFALVLTIGMVAGTYSSIFLASPLLIYIERYQKVTPPETAKK
jgi:preprotein translocase subunit SecF